MVLRHGNLSLEWLKHDGFRISSPSKILYIDPYGLSEGVKADVVCISHGHYDHLDEASLQAIMTDRTVVICPEDLRDFFVRHFPDSPVYPLAPYRETITGEIKIGTTPAYNENKPFNPREKQWLGFIIEWEGTVIFFAGDTDALPELEKIRCDIALLPVSGIYVMNAEEASRLANRIMPRVAAVPMHWGAIKDEEGRPVGRPEDARLFRDHCRCPVVILDPVSL